MKLNNDNLPAPSRGARVLWWFGIYFAAQIPLIPWSYRLAQMWPLFPLGMETGFVCLVGAILPRSVVQAGGTTLYDAIWTVGFFLPWAAYISHLICTLSVRKRRSFLVLVWILIGILTLNIAGCALFLHDPPE